MMIRKHLLSPRGRGQFRPWRAPGHAAGEGAAGACARDGRGGPPLVTEAACGLHRKLTEVGEVQRKSALG